MNTVEGLPQLLSKLSAFGSNGERITKASINAVADMIVVDAKLSAPADLGTIRQNIGKEQITDYLVSVFSAAPESAFQEFGTGGKVDVPEEMADVASEFQGASGGDMAAFILALTGWVQRHGLTGVYSVKTHRKNTKLSNADEDEQVAWAIAKTILRDGLTPQPFLYPAFVKNSSKLVPMLQTALKELLAG